MGLFRTSNKRSGDTDVLAAATPLKDIPAPTEVPLDNEVVHNTGNENVDGSKFFRDQTYFGDSTAYVSIKSNGDIIKKSAGSTSLTTYSLPSGGGTFAMKSDFNNIIATSGTLGTVKVGDGLNIDQTGVLSITDDESFFRYKITTPETTTSTTSATDDTISVTLKNSAVNTVSAGSGTDYIIMTFPDKKQGYARDFFVRLVLTGTDVPTISCCEPSGGGAVEFDVDDDSWQNIDLGVNLLMFTETAQLNSNS